MEVEEEVAAVFFFPNALDLHSRVTGNGKSSDSLPLLMVILATAFLSVLLY